MHEVGFSAVVKYVNELKKLNYYILPLVSHLWTVSE